MSVFTQRPRLLLSAFAMNTTSHILGGQWRHPDAQQHRFNELQLWVDLARELEEAKFDAMFFADVVGLYGDHEGGWASMVERGLQVPSNDPLVLCSALAAVTKDIGLAMTSSVIQSDPFQLARQLSTRRASPRLAPPRASTTTRGRSWSFRRSPTCVPARRAPTWRCRRRRLPADQRPRHFRDR